MEVNIEFKTTDAVSQNVSNLAVSSFTITRGLTICHSCHGSPIIIIDVVVVVVRDDDNEGQQQQQNLQSEQGMGVASQTRPPYAKEKESPLQGS
jgi:hypothetical protein